MNEKEFLKKLDARINEWINESPLLAREYQQICQLSNLKNILQLQGAFIPVLYSCLWKGLAVLKRTLTQLVDAL